MQQGHEWKCDLLVIVRYNHAASTSVVDENYIVILKLVSVKVKVSD